jgi:predicted alpha/beta hydrolase family esterase
MTKLERPTIVAVPGLRGGIPDHWQERMAAELPNVRHLPTTGRGDHSLERRVADLQHEVEAARGPVVLVAHSAGVLTTVHWANRYGTGVQGAILATPPVLARPLSSEYPSLVQLAEAGWLPIPGSRLPFPSIVAASRNDDLGDFEDVRGLAEAWGSHLVDLGRVGHLNPASGFGDWRWAEPLLEALASMVSFDQAAQAQA